MGGRQVSLPWKIPRIKTGSSATLGKQIVQWSQSDPQKRPTTVGEVKSGLAGQGVTLEFPDDDFDNDTPVTFVETALDEWVVRLPPPELIDEVLQQIAAGNGYPVLDLPVYFSAYPKHGARYDEDFLYVRLADFSISQCG